MCDRVFMRQARCYGLLGPNFFFIFDFFFMARTPEMFLGSWTSETHIYNSIAVNNAQFWKRINFIVLNIQGFTAWDSHWTTPRVSWTFVLVVNQYRKAWMSRANRLIRPYPSSLHTIHVCIESIEDLPFPMFADRILLWIVSDFFWISVRQNR